MSRRSQQNHRGAPDMVRRSWETCGAASPRQFSPVRARADRPRSGHLDSIVLKFTTLSSETAPCRAFVVNEANTTIGRGPGNSICIGSDATMDLDAHAVIERDSETGSFWLSRAPGGGAAAVAVRVSVGEVARDWPLWADVEFVVGNSLFIVEAVEVEPPRLQLAAKLGPTAGTTTVVGADGATLGRSYDSDIAVADRELSRRHSRVTFDEALGAFYLCDLASTNGTYVRLAGPYAAPVELNLRDHILVARTGFSVNRFDYGVAEQKGARRTMEDRTIVVQDLCVEQLPAFLRPQSYAAVYDGHGGAHASAFLRQALHGEVAGMLATTCEVDFAHAAAAGAAVDEAADADDAADGATPGCAGLEASLREALRRVFVETDERFLCESEKPQAGSTACVLLVLGTLVVCANVGDSRALLCRRGVAATALSRDHKPSCDDEAARIKAAGGFVIHKRVMGELAVSRAFGDVELKRSVSDMAHCDEAANGRARPSSWPPSAARATLVVADPEVTFARLHKDDEFAILACDGLFDVFSDDDAADFVRRELDEHGDPQLAAERLSTAAIDG
ncbi:phosphatase 2C-like domain-containing protein [Pelagophyceae sp. CCMP2097]|nr:phosphatase 2C-like domain-containing protein [Pelagophyceae sp. CCMP2097]